MKYSLDLTDKIILITGGYGHLGKAITEILSENGGTVYVLGKSYNKFKNRFAGNKEIGNSINFEECDISSTNSIQEAFENVYQTEGKIDVLINNAVYSKGQDPLKMTDEDWATGLDGTLSSVFRCIREIIPFIENSKTPRIINVSSMYGVVAPNFEIYNDFEEMLNPPHYGAAKAGVIQLSKYYASLLGEKGITVNTVTPGAFPSESVQVKEEFIEVLKEKTLLKRIGNPEDLGGVFVFLASEASSYITGQNIIVDGGWTVK